MLPRDPLVFRSRQYHGKNGNSNEQIDPEGDHPANAVCVIRVAIDDGTYKVRLFASGYSFVVPETLTVSGDGSVTYQGVSFLPVSPPSAPDLCVIFGMLRDAGGSPVVGAEVDAYGVTPQAGGGYQIGPQIASTISDTNGYFELELMRNVLVQFKIDAVDVEFIRTVPDAPSQYLTTWPED